MGRDAGGDRGVLDMETSNVGRNELWQSMVKNSLSVCPMKYCSIWPQQTDDQRLQITIASLQPLK